MIKEFWQLDDGAFPGKLVVDLVGMDTLTKEEIEMVMEAVNLIKEKRGGEVKGRNCLTGANRVNI